MYAGARGDVQNNPHTNGEYALVNRLAALWKDSDGPVVLDVGANIGNWSAELLRSCRDRGVRPSVHAFEPCSSTYAALADRFKGVAAITTHRIALGDSRATVELAVEAPLAGTNSLACRHGGLRETVTVDTVDDFLLSHAVARVSMVKTDTEGFDFHVMRGARHALADRMIDLWQFEYNWRWIDCRHFLRDVFDLADKCGYEVGKVTTGGKIDVYETWSPELERFFEANYVLVRCDSWCGSLCTRYRLNRSNLLERLSRD